MITQKELDHNRPGQFYITEYEDNFIPTPAFGPWESDEAFTDYFDFDFFSDEKLQSTISDFLELTIKAGLSNKNYLLIEAGIKSFTDSSTKLNKEQALLYHSVLNWQPDILINKFQLSSEEIQQTIGMRYFEDFENLKQFPFSNESLIPDEAMSIYRICAEVITLKTLREWVKFSLERNGDMAWASDFDRILIYRGLNNSRYYQRRQKKSDLISVYAGTEGESFPYFEKFLLSSYTLSPNLAEQFMVGSLGNKSKRRTLIEGHTEIIQDRLFTSFVVSPNFRPYQYEFVCLPDLKYILATEKFSTEIYTSIVLSNTY